MLLLWRLIVELVVEAVVEIVVEVIFVVVLLIDLLLDFLRLLPFSLFVSIPLLLQVRLNCLVGFGEVEGVHQLTRDLQMAAILIIHIGINVYLLCLVVRKDVVLDVELEDLCDLWLDLFEPVDKANILETLCFFHLLTLIRVSKVLLNPYAPAHRLRVRLIVKEEIVLCVEVYYGINSNRLGIPSCTLRLIALVVASLGPLKLV